LNLEVSSLQKYENFLHRLPRELFTAAQVRALDAEAIASGVSSYELMRRAALVVLSGLRQRWPQTRRLLVFVGTGNNGGDGYLVATLAHAEGFDVRVFEVGDSARRKGDAIRAREEFLTTGLRAHSWHDFDALNAYHSAADTVVVDALLGTGLSGAVKSPFDAAIRLINSLSLPVVAVDIPSGLASDTGWCKLAVQAQMTISFIGLKQGLFTALGPECAGEILFHDLGTAVTLSQSDIVRAPASRRIDIASASKLLPPRSKAVHKGSCGNVLVVGGDLGYGGAALMAAQAAARAGAGTVSLATRSAHVCAALARQPEIMVGAVDAPAGADYGLMSRLLERADVVLLGPGLGQSEWSKAMLGQVLQFAGDKLPLVVDADALNLLAANAQLRREISPLPEKRQSMRRRQWILTPHPGEAARLLGCEIDQVQQDRFAAVRQLQAVWGGACLLKGAGSLVCYEETGATVVHLCSEGNPGMASGGMGDVLGGIVAAFVAQGLDYGVSLTAAVCVHGEAADLSAQAGGERGMQATDLLEYIRGLVNVQ
jgi:hydroxyethylthiazole kinase-like uncharacterized protein yjeF